jgi:hypothetical protein
MSSEEALFGTNGDCDDCTDEHDQLTAVTRVEMMELTFPTWAMSGSTVAMKLEHAAQASQLAWVSL